MKLKTILTLLFIIFITMGCATTETSNLQEERKKKLQEEATEENEVNVSNDIDTSTETPVDTSEPVEPSNEENVSLNVEDTIVHDGETVGTNETEKTLEQALNEL